ncbi:MAG: zinc-binding dehydrogenase [Anaerolineales bacterium]
MKAMLITEFGGPEVFEPQEVGQPEIRPNDVLVNVHATSVNPVDTKIREAGQWAGINPPAVIGYDVSGVVEAVGEGVVDFAIGDEVFYTPDLFDGAGSYAEYHAAHEQIVAHKPENLSHTEAASLPLAGATAFQALILRAKLRAAETVLIHGVGGVGSLAVQIAKAAGAYVIATCSDYMIAPAQELGADLTIHYKKSDDFIPAVLEATDNFGVDVVFDTVGSDLLTRSIEVTKPFGRMVGIVSTDTGFRAAFAKNIDVYPLFLQRDRYKLDALRNLVERGQLKPVIDSVMPLTDVAEAHRRLEKGGVKGKIVLKI